MTALVDEWLSIPVTAGLQPPIRLKAQALIKVCNAVNDSPCVLRVLILSIKGIKLQAVWHSAASGRDFSIVSGYGSRDSVCRMTALDDERLFIPVTPGLPTSIRLKTHALIKACNAVNDYHR